jgi:hypothetical protein
MTFRRSFDNFEPFGPIIENEEAENVFSMTWHKGRGWPETGSIDQKSDIKNDPAATMR